MSRTGLIILLTILVLTIGGLAYLLYERAVNNRVPYYKGDIRKTPNYYKGKMENAPNYYKGSLKKVKNYYKKDIKDMPNYYKPPSNKPSDRASKLRSLKENW
ncbi:hypothetical protein [Persephonella sp. KM09-Lau-8]|uniref:hypothetical protein n=1 Tax=Persephonella sp. KM09-Lau-8 TaxID=1158345 RepID=UPI000496E9C0|nr:hypothetical protein [Persephonella sp. KM09-Lau-8]